jgi:hypothetical protein
MAVAVEYGTRAAAWAPTVNGGAALAPGTGTGRDGGSSARHGHARPAPVSRALAARPRAAPADSRGGPAELRLA